MLVALAIAFAAFDVLIGHYGMNDLSVPAALGNTGESVRIKTTDVVADAADERVIWEAEASMDAPQYPLDTGEPQEGQRIGEAAAPTASASAAHENTGAPVRITIPSIVVDAVVEKVTLAADGSMGVPKRPDDVAWYALGPRPGETGSAIIAGHVDSMYGDAAVFADLHKLKAGDKITVEDDRGGVISFVVRESRKYDAAADATNVFSSNDGKAHVNLITCSGTWDKSARQYTERLVVFADREME